MNSTTMHEYGVVAHNRRLALNIEIGSWHDHNTAMEICIGRLSTESGLTTKSV